MTKTINVARDFSRYPAGRNNADGPYSGERFRNELLFPQLKNKIKTVIELDGTRGFGSSFLEEAFGGLRRLGYSIKDIHDTFIFKSSDQSLIDEIKEYISHE